MSFLAFALELYFAATLGVSSLTKINNPQYFTETLTQQRLVPSWSISLITRVFPWVECILAALLLTAIEPVISSLLLAGLFIFFLIIKIVLLVTGRTKDCGCYGSAKPQTIDGMNIVVSLILSFFALIHIWLTIQFHSVNWQWRLVAEILFLIGWCFLLRKTIVRRRKNSHSMLTPLIDLGGLDKGEKAPLFTGIDQYSRRIYLDRFEGKWLLLAFVSPGCPACPEAIKALQKILNDDPTFSVLVIASPDLEVNRQYAAEQQFNFPIATSTPELIHNLYQVRVFPFIFVLDKEGIIRAKGAASAYDLLRNLIDAATAPSEVTNAAKIK